jgi:hypothetical protein
MVYFQTKIPTLGKFWRALEWNMFAYLMTIWNILRTIGITYIWPFGIVCGDLIYVFNPILVCLDQEKSGNPG